MEAAVKQQVRSDWTGAILVCGKCSKKTASGGERLSKQLRKALGVKTGRRAALGVIETKCLGICPKRGVVVIDTARPERWEIVASDTPVAEVLGRLGRGQA